MSKKIRVSKRRRRQGKTDYKARLSLLKSGKPRVVFRKTNKYIIGQFIESKGAEDSIIVGVVSKDLLKHSWPKEAEGSLKSMPASYLTGYLLGKRVGDKEAIFDLGLLRNIAKSKAFGFLKGVIDAGVKIKASKEVFPDEERIKGKDLKNKIDFDKIKGSIENA